MLRLMTAVAFAGVMSLTCLAQSDASASEKQSAALPAAGNVLKQFYHLRFVLQEMESDRVINSRSYSVIMSDKDQSSIRAGEKVPFSSASGASTMWQQIDVGVNIDCRKLETTSNGVALDIKAEISSVMESHGANSPPPSLPIIRNNQWESRVVLPVKQPTVLFSSDDPASKRTMQLKLTVTPIVGS
jgi:hypothetical protein